MSEAVTFREVECGDMSVVPPDAPAGSWTATCAVKKSKTKKDSYPMLVLEWRLTEAHQEENEGSVGAKVTDFLTFFPATHPATRMGRQRLLDLCKALDIDVPAATAIKSWDDIQDFIDALEGSQATVYTSVAPRKDNGEMATSVRYTNPNAARSVPPPADDSEEDDVAAPVAKKAAKKKSKAA